MWFIFPQLRALGASSTSIYFGINGIREAHIYFEHSILGFRLLECTKAMNDASCSDANQILGEIDSVKFRSSMTLFAYVAPAEDCFKIAIERFFMGIKDPRTILALDHLR